MTVENDEEIGRLVRLVCARIAYSELSQEAIFLLIAALEEVCVWGRERGREI